MSAASSAAAYPRLRGRRNRFSLQAQICFGMIVGSAVGLIIDVVAPDASWVDLVVTNLTEPFGDLFLQLLFILALPLLFAAVITGVAGLRDFGMLRRLGLTWLAYIFASTVLAALIGLAAVNLFRPGDGIDHVGAYRALAERGMEAMTITGGPSQVPYPLLNLIPSSLVRAAFHAGLSKMLCMLFVAFLVGSSLVLVQTEAAHRLEKIVEDAFQIGMRVVGIVLRLAPIAVTCFWFNVTVMYGWGLLAHLGAYLAVVLLASALHMGVVLAAMLWIGGGYRPTAFFGSVREAAWVAFATTSSTATFPTAMKVAEQRLGIPADIARFVLGVGTSSNQNGSTIYLAVTVVFLAQALGVQLEFSQQVAVFAICVLAGIATAGVPAGSLPVVALALVLIGIPPTAIGLIIAVDRLLDMCRTTLNVVGDLAIAVTLVKTTS